MLDPIVFSAARSVGRPNYSSGYKSGKRPILHGSDVEIVGSGFGTNMVTKTFLGGAEGLTENTLVGTTPRNGNGWSFDDLLHDTKIYEDPVRGKVIRSSTNSTILNGTRIFDPGFVLPENTKLRWCWWVKSELSTDGVPYTSRHQFKLGRIAANKTIQDGPMQIGYHNWPVNDDSYVFFNPESGSSDTRWGASSIYPNTGWARVELLVDTGTVGGNNGTIIQRITRDGVTTTGVVYENKTIYDATARLRYFASQNYFGNWADDQAAPTMCLAYTDDEQIIIGSWKWLELADTPTGDATIKETIDWKGGLWTDEAIVANINKGGLPAGKHSLYVRVVDGLTKVGNQYVDNVIHSFPIEVVV